MGYYSPGSPTVQYSPRVTATAVGNVYTLDARITNEVVTAAPVAANTTITVGNLASVPIGSVWRGVLTFSYTSGAITLAGGTATAKPPASLPTLVAGRTYEIMARYVGGDSVLTWTYINGDGYTT